MPNYDEPTGPETGKAGAVYAQIKAMILGNHLRPQTRLVPVALAARLSVSQTPIREALQRLAAERLIFASPNRGYFYTPPKLDEVCNLYELGAALLKYAIVNPSRPFISEGLNVPTLGRFRRSGKLSEAWVQTHVLFTEQLYERIVEMANNEEIERIVRNFIDRTHVVRVLDFERAEAATLINQGMTELVGLLIAGDAKAASANIDAQWKLKRERVPELVSRAMRQANGRTKS